MAQYATITQTVKQIFPEIMRSAGSVHIPMSKGIFKPEVHNEAPVPCKLSVADLVTLGLLHLWFQSGIQYDDLKGTGSVRFLSTPEAETSTRRYLSLRLSPTFVIDLDLLGLNTVDRENLLPQGFTTTACAIGKDRVLQRFFEAHAFNLICILRPFASVRPGRGFVGYAVAIASDPDSPILREASGFSARISVDDDGEPVDPEPGDHYLGYTTFHIKLIQRHIIKRLPGEE